MSDNTVNVNVTANTAELQSGMQQAPSLVQRAAEQMRGHFTKLRADTAEHMGKAAEAVSSSTSSMGGAISGLSGAFSKVNIAFAAVAAILGGGAMFASGIKATQQFTGEANKLARTLSITTSEASTLNVALGDIYTDAETFTGAASMLGRQLKQNEGELQRMGLATRDSHGNLRNLNDLMMDSIKVINGYKEGTDRNLAAMTLWGRGASEATGLLKLNNDVLEAAKKKQEELGLTVGQENVEASKRYKAAMNDVGDVMLALKKAIGDAVMPILTRLGEWFAEVAPPAVFAFKVALDAVATAVHVVIGALRQLWIVVSTIADPIATLGRAIRMLIQGDVKGAQEEMTNIFSNWGDAFSKLGDRMKEDAKQTWTDITALWGKPTATAAKTGKGKNYETKPDKDKAEKDPSQMAAFEAQLEAEKVVASERDALHGMSKQAEAAFWAGILNLTTLNEKDRLHVSKKASAARVAVLQEEAQQADQIGQAQLSAWEQRNLAVVDQDEETARNRVVLGFGTQADLLAQEQEFENRRYEIKMAAAQANLAALDPMRDPVQVAQLNTQIEALEQAHQMRLAQIRGQIAVESAAEMNAIWTDLSGRMSSLWDSGVNAMMNGTLTWRNAMRAIGAEMVGWFAGVVKKKVVAWALGEQAKTGATAAGTAQRWLMESWAAAKSVALWAATAVKNIMTSAWEAMAAAWKAVVGIPYVGPVLAVAAAGAAFAGVSAIAGKVASAEGGYDIPAGVNPMTQLHEKEMVLPAKQADVIRDLADGGSGGAVGGGGPVVLKATPLKGNFFMVHRDDLAAAFKSLKRDFVL
ncbi:hypothetical protein DBR47_14340 [Paucibacter sp. KBW04]|uniref:hypothetical protein n=1 Tax=Paucibacter sp. KBW04 TaxID=2153361 RepID=UPI000F57FC11|nr:hypothetical protein [Paucibacter sp. KBW04]RQO57969.1 hypothetical protein DBR47_14340 [Paucibacter sp. KBW04]